MTDTEKIEKLVAMVKYLSRFVGLFIKKEVSELLREIEE